MKLEGSLDTFPLRELIDMAVYSSVTGAINIFSHGEQGRLYFRDGILYHATRGYATGITALAELLEYTGGTFAIVGDVTVDDESLWGALSQHLQTAERLASRWRMIRPYVPTLDLTPALLVPHETAQRRIGPAHQALLPLIDGQNTLHQIAAAVGWSEIDVAEAIVQMNLDGLVDFRSLRAAQPPASQPAEASSAGTGLFDRLRARAQSDGPPPEALLINDARASEDLILKLLRS